MSDPLRILLAGSPHMCDQLQPIAEKHGHELIVDRFQKGDESAAECDLVIASAETIASLAAHDFDATIVLPASDDEAAMATAIQAGALVVPNGSPRLLTIALERALCDAIDRRHRIETERVLAKIEERYQDLIEIANDVVLTLDLEGNFTALNAAGETISGYTREEVQAMNMRDVLTPESYQLALQMIQQKLQTGQATTYELEMIARDGHLVPLEVSSKIIYHDGKPAGIHAIARDVTERHRAEQERRLRERKQAAVARLGQQALETADLSSLFDDAVGHVAETLDVEYSSVLELVEDGTLLTARAGIGWREGVVEHESVGAGPVSQAGFALLSSEPVVVRDLRSETRFAVPPVLQEHDVVSGISVIIHGHEWPFGVLSAFTCHQRDLTQDDVHFLQVVANVLAAAVERKRLEDQRAQHDKELAARVLQAQEDERKRIARELHDETAQTLSILLANLDLLQSRIPKDDASITAGFHRLEALARRALDETRALSHDLRPPILDDAGLAAALEWIAAEHEREFGGTVRVSAPTELEDKLAPEVEVALFRIAQEALTNTGKHAQATRVRLSLSLKEKLVELAVKDNGKGFDPDRVQGPRREGGLGIYGMAERAALFGGSLAIRSTPEKGTELRVRMPLTRGTAAPASRTARAGAS